MKVNLVQLEKVINNGGSYSILFYDEDQPLKDDSDMQFDLSFNELFISQRTRTIFLKSQNGVMRFNNINNINIESVENFGNKIEFNCGCINKKDFVLFQKYMH